MIGQGNLINIINSYTIDTLPRSLMLIGEYGCGKHTLCHYISDKFNLNYVDISDNLSYESIDYLYSCAIPTLVVINITNSYIREQNLILKFLEEPPKFSFVVVLCENDYGILETIKNRCQRYRFESYTINELSEFIPPDNKYADLILRLANTPGKINDFVNCDIDSLYSYATYIIDNFKNSSIGNVLNISNRIAYNNEQDKFPIIPFVSVLLLCLKDKYLTDTDNYYITLYENICRMSSELSIQGIDKRNVIEHYLLKSRIDIG